jgi:hypothetical protein
LEYRFGIVNGRHTPVSIAAAEVKEHSTLYFIPNTDRSRFRGDEIERSTLANNSRRITWNTLPKGTIVVPSVEYSDVTKVTRDIRKNFSNYQRMYKRN